MIVQTGIEDRQPVLRIVPLKGRAVVLVVALISTGRDNLGLGGKIWGGGILYAVNICAACEMVDESRVGVCSVGEQGDNGVIQADAVARQGCDLQFN